MSLRNERLQDLANAVYGHVRAMLDAEIDFTGDDAARVATACQAAFEAATAEWLHPLIAAPLGWGSVETSVD
ncbi:hypothetical protein [Anatilimnocola floriformis]|uniref:hypothetical protein n=1 Tax=Anatilimnocola floriformis TaxID=2948575 RepID=UPI0020C310A4|nr:hypothetical protein [Anatilimnocola floriformis]